MLFPNVFDNPAGDYQTLFKGPVGDIECFMTIPPDCNKDYMAMLGHPHSLQGGTMNNKVVTTMAGVFKALGIASIRFNFRGVGQSSGVYDAGMGESEDLCFLVKQCQGAYPTLKFIFAGFSFGSYVTYRAAALCKPVLLISIAPPVHHYDYTEFNMLNMPWIVVQGDADEVVPAEEVLTFIQKNLGISYIDMPGVGHFFHGQLVALKVNLIESVKTTLGLA